MESKPTHPSADFIIVQVHQRAGETTRVTWVVLFTLSDVNKALCEAVAVLGIVAAAAPDPVAVQVGRPILNKNEVL